MIMKALKGCTVRYLHPADHNQRRITKADKDFAKKLDFKDKNFQSSLENSIGISLFGYENKEKHPIYVSKKCCEEKHVDLLLIAERKRHCFYQRF